MSDRRIDVLVVGAGPVGLAALARLDASGFRARLLEAGPDTAPAAEDAQWDPRVYALGPAAIAQLESVGAWSRVPPTRRAAITAMNLQGHEPEPELVLRAGDAGLEHLGCIVEHRQLVSALRRSIDPARIEFGVSVERCEPGTDAVRVHCADGRSLRAGLVVAADGPGSPLRAASGQTTDRWRYGQTAIVCYLRTGQAHRGHAFQRFAPEGTIGVLPIADGRSSLVWSVSDARATELMGLDDAAFASQLEAALGGRLGEIRCDGSRHRFELQGLQLRAFGGVRTAFVGDAAHVLHPLAGQGLNLGFGDVDVLVDRLDAGRERGLPPGARRTLAAYDRARRARSTELLALTDGLHRLFAQRSEVLRVGIAGAWHGLNRMPLLREALIRLAVAG